MRLFALLLATLWLAAFPAQAQDLAIVNARVYAAPDRPPLDDAAVVVRNGRIAYVGPAGRARIPRGVQVIDGRGLIVAAGFWNSHVHLLAPPFFQATRTPAPVQSQVLEGMFTRWGFTSVFDIASLPGDAIALRRRIATGEVTGPTILTADAPFYPNDGMPIYARDLVPGAPSFELGSGSEAVERARRQLRGGADGVKLFTGSIVGGDIGVLPMPREAARAVADAAHRAGGPVFAHPSNNEGLEIAIFAGVDVLAHTTPDGGPWPADMAARLKAEDVALVPTLTLWRVELGKQNAPADRVDRFVAAGQRQLKAFADAGGQVLFGTDVGYTDVTDTTQEYVLMAEAGLSWRQILASLTTAPANRFGFLRKGRVARGFDGDLAILAADPATDVRAFAQVAYTVRDGRVIYQRGPAPGGR